MFSVLFRFRVESMESADEDVRIKEAADVAKSSNIYLDCLKATSSQDTIASVTSVTGESSIGQNLNKLKCSVTSQKLSGYRGGKIMRRSKSVSTPQNVSHKTDVEYSCQASANDAGSFSTMSCKDLENWKLAAISPESSTVILPADTLKEEPILTLASSLEGSSNITVGFNIPQD